VPDGDGPFPAVLFMPGAPGARYTFYTEALELAKRGILALLPDPPYSRPPIEEVVNFTARDEEGIVQEVKEMRRGIDLLVSRDDVDPSRLGYVGFSWGASVERFSRAWNAASAPSSSCRRSRGSARI
jgi:dienelactone hydrolase